MSGSRDGGSLGSDTSISDVPYYIFTFTKTIFDGDRLLRTLNNSKPRSTQIIEKAGTREILFTTRQEYRWPENAVIFCNFIQLYKFDPDVQKMWVTITILHKVPKTVTWTSPWSRYQPAQPHRGRAARPGPVAASGPLRTRMTSGFRPVSTPRLTTSAGLVASKE